MALRDGAIFRCAGEIENGLRWECVLSKEQLSLAIEAEAPVAPAPPQPNGYAYRYPDGIRFNHGLSVNGSDPIEVIPFYYGTPPARSEAEDFNAGIEAAAKIVDTWMGSMYKLAQKIRGLARSSKG